MILMILFIILCMAGFPIGWFTMTVAALLEIGTIIMIEWAIHRH